MTADGEPTGTDEVSATDAPDDSNPSRLLLVLRSLAVVLVLTGFYGAFTREVSPVAPDTVFGVAFLAGVAFAITSVYLGIFLGGEDDSGD